MVQFNVAFANVFTMGKLSNDEKCIFRRFMSKDFGLSFSIL